MKDSHALALLNIPSLESNIFHWHYKERGGGEAPLSPSALLLLSSYNEQKIFMCFLQFLLAKYFCHMKGILCFPIADWQFHTKRGTLLSTMNVYTNFIINLGDV
jgi:hypothetical protein